MTMNVVLKSRLPNAAEDTVCSASRSSVLLYLQSERQGYHSHEPFSKPSENSKQLAVAGLLATSTSDSCSCSQQCWPSTTADTST